MSILEYKRPEPKRHRKYAYLREYQIKHRARLTQQSRNFRNRNRELLRVRWGLRAKYRRWMYWDKEHAKERKRHLKKNYGLTAEAYDAMLSAQKGVCAICGRPESRSKKRRYLSVDHDHITGNVRALLCHDCNTTLGVLREDVTVLEAMIAYVKKHKTR